MADDHLGTERVIRDRIVGEVDHLHWREAGRRLGVLPELVGPPAQRAERNPRMLRELAEAQTLPLT